MKKPVLETERLLLTEFDPSDAPGMFALNNDPEVMRYLGDKPFASVEATEQFIRDYAQYRLRGFGRWTVRLRDTGDYVGWCGLRLLDDIGRVDLGYRFLKKYWGQGLATEASRACVQYGFETLGLREIIGRAYADNTASIRVLEKAGMHFDSFVELDGGIPSVLYVVMNNGQ